MSPTPLKKRWSLRKTQVMRRTLQADPTLEYFVYVPSSGGQGAPLFIAVHGISRNARELAKMFAGLAESAGVVLVAPHFPADRYPDYQRLGRSDRGARADAALDSITQEVAWLTGAATTQLFLFGYSGGAQFVHRYAMAHPHRVARVAVAAAGWYTLPSRARRFPYGIRPGKKLRSVRPDPEEFLRIPTAVFVGENDVTSDGLRHSERLDREQGVTRVERAYNWVEAMRAAAVTYQLEPRITLEQIAGAHHSFKYMMKRGQLGERVFESLFGIPFKRSEDGDDVKQAQQG